MGAPVTMTRVVNIRNTALYDVYIGRPSPWGNPYKIGQDGTRQEVLAKFRTYLDKHPQLVRQARVALKGKRLGCYCHPLPCHGDIWVQYIEGMEP